MTANSSQNEMLTYGSLFTGIGGFDLGFDRAGLRCAWQVEQDKTCQSVLARHWPAVHRGNDVCTVTPGSGFAPIDVLCGGFPCQDLSVAGRRKGLAGERSGLFWEFHRIAQELAPRVFVLENVPGLYSSHGGRDLLSVIRGMEELGYRIAWCCLDSEYFHVPQRRERTFIVGCLGTGSAPQILFEPESVRWDPPPSREKGKEVAGTIGGSSQSGGFRTTDLDNNGAFIVNGHSSYASGLPCLRAKGGDCAGGSEALVTHALTSEGFEDGTGRGTPLVAFSCKDHGADAGEISPTLRSMEFDQSHANGGGQIAIAIPIQEIGKRQSGTPMNGVGYGKDGDPMFTLQRAAEHGVAVAFAQNTRDEVRLQSGDGAIVGALSSEPGTKQQTYVNRGMMVRRLTPRECERLQGFPDDWTRWDDAGKEISDSARYRMLGNAVTTYVAEWIGRRIFSVIDSHPLSP